MADAQEEKKLFVGGLPWRMSNEELKEMFEECGEVTDAFIPRDRETGRSKGFGFVEFATQEGAQAAVEKFDQSEFDGRALNVNFARPKTEN